MLHACVFVESSARIHRRHGATIVRRIDGELEGVPTVVLARPLHAARWRVPANVPAVQDQLGEQAQIVARH